jgi:glycosyltransferase involved in cell wall biosynthesis
MTIISKPLNIAIVAPFEETVPPQGYGGTEQIVSNLTEELVKRGNNVTLFSVGGTKTSANLVEIFDQPLRLNPQTAQDSAKREAYKIIGVGKILEYLKSSKFDIVHNHISWRTLPFHHLVPCPVVTTIHHPLNGDTVKYGHVIRLYKDQPYISISYAQRDPLPEANYIANVYHGIDVSSFDFNPHPQDYLAFLSRMSPEKGPIEAIEIARHTGKKLIMAAKVDQDDRKFFTEQVEPWIDGQQIQFIGEVNHQQKVELLKNAQALLAPIQWDEPFGLYFIEAMACGTPILSIRRGSTPEIIEDTVTGLLADSASHLAQLVPEVTNLDRAVIRDTAEKRFTISSMVDGYEQAYAKLLK